MKGGLYFMTGAALGAAVTYWHCTKEDPTLEKRLQREAEDLAIKTQRIAEDLPKTLERKAEDAELWAKRTAEDRDYAEAVRESRRRAVRHG